MSAFNLFKVQYSIINEFGMVLTLNKDYFPKHCYFIGLYVKDIMNVHREVWIGLQYVT